MVEYRLSEELGRLADLLWLAEQPQTEFFAERPRPAQLLLCPGKASFLAYFRGTLSPGPQSAGELLGKLAALSDAAFTAQLLQYADIGHKTPSYYARLNAAEAAALAGGWPHADAYRLEFLLFLASPAQIRPALQKWLEKLAAAVTELRKTRAPQLEAAKNRLNDHFVSQKLRLLNQPEQPLQVALCALNTHALYTEKQPYTLYIGTEEGQTDLDWNTIGKLFSDPRRCEILERLSGESLYLHQLAKQLKMPVSSAIYHVQLLTEARALLSQSREGKNYLTLNPAFFNDIARFAAAYRDRLEGQHNTAAGK